MYSHSRFGVDPAPSIVPGEGSPGPFYEKLGFVYTGGEDRTVRRFELDTEGKPATDTTAYAHRHQFAEA